MNDKSPLQQYCEDIDRKYMDKTWMELYYEVALKVDRQYFTNLVLNDFQWRANHQQNIVASIEGQQGCGKSLFANDMCMRIGEMFGGKFDVSTDLYINPFDLDHELRNANSRRRTFLYDEQPQRRVGMGSVSTSVSLKDYEEICRYTQNNLVYCSPEMVDHAHYFIFKEVDYGVERLKVAKCGECSKYAACHADYYSTLCELEFWERDGYPVSFSFMLQTKRMADNMFVPRGVVKLPMISWKSAQNYNGVKAKNIKKFESFQNDSWDNQKILLKKFVDEHEDELFIKLKKGGFKIAPSKRIDSIFFDEFGTERFTNRQVEVFVEIIKKELEGKLESYINENGANIVD